MATITSIDKPRCSRCGQARPVDELNGYNPLAPVGQKYRAAYCRALGKCTSAEAEMQMVALLKQFE